MNTSTRQLFSFSTKSQLDDLVVFKNEIESANQNNLNGIEYKKYNPFLLGKNNSNNKKVNILFNFVKFSIAILLFTFALLSLWYTTQWKQNTLLNLGIVLDKHIDFLKSDSEYQKIVDTINEANKLSLSQWSNTSNSNLSSIIEVLIAFSFIGIISIIPLLVFKNGTAFSIASLSISFISLVIIITLFAMCLSLQQQVASIYNDKDPKIQDLISQLENHNSKIKEYQKEIKILNDKINASTTPVEEKTKLQETLKEIEDLKKGLETKKSELEVTIPKQIKEMLVDILNKVKPIK